MNKTGSFCWKSHIGSSTWFEWLRLNLQRYLWAHFRLQRWEVCVNLSPISNKSRRARRPVSLPFNSIGSWYQLTIPEQHLYLTSLASIPSSTHTHKKWNKEKKISLYISIKFSFSFPGSSPPPVDWFIYLLYSFLSVRHFLLSSAPASAEWNSIESRGLCALFSEFTPCSDEEHDTKAANSTNANWTMPRLRQIRQIRWKFPDQLSSICPFWANHFPAMKRICGRFSRWFHDPVDFSPLLPPGGPPPLPPLSLSLSTPAPTSLPPSNGIRNPKWVGSKERYPISSSAGWRRVNLVAPQRHLLAFSLNLHPPHMAH